MHNNLLTTLQRFKLVLTDQFDDVLDWVKNENQSDQPDRIGISQRLGFLAAVQAYNQITDRYMDEWNFVSEEEFGRAIQIAGDSFRAYVAEAHIIPNGASWFAGIKGQLLNKLQEELKSEGFFDQALEKSLEEYDEIIDEEIRNGFDIAFDFIKELTPEDFEIEISASFEEELIEQAEQAEKEGGKALSKLLQSLGFKPK